MDQGANIGFLSYLLVLQAIMIPWSAAIVRVAVRVVRGDNAEDVRSDDEDEDEDVTEDEKTNFEEAPMVEEEVEAESIDFEAWKRRSGVRQTARSSGNSLSRHSDRKELLNRIGCERQIE
jgi:acyl-CoA-dependent ceramide synthase